MSPATVDVAIVNWNTSGAARRAASAFLASEGVEARVTMVDNRSRPDERELLRKECPELARVLLAERNLGYGAAANLGLADGEADLVCVSNADLLPEPWALARLAEVALKDPSAGMVGAVFGGGTQHYHSELPGPATLLVRSIFGSFGRGRTPAPGAGETVPTGQVSGACFVVRRGLWEEVGGFDEGYFLWYDDVDLAKRMRDRGYRNLVVGAARVEHIGAGSFSQLERRTAQAIRLASLRRYIALHHPRALPLARPLLRLARATRARRAGEPKDRP